MASQQVKLIPLNWWRTREQILEIDTTGDRERCENWFKKYGQMPEELKTALKAASDVPVDVDPAFKFAERVKWASF